MWYYKVNSILLLSLPLFLIKIVNSSRTYNSKFLESALIEQTLSFMNADNLLDNYEMFVAELYKEKNHSCVRSLKIWKRARQNRESWALQMRDAWSTVPAGLFQGNLVDFGMYDECVAAGGRYCIYEINPTHQKTAFLLVPQLSVCLPRDCTADDVSQLVNATIEKNIKLKNQISLITTSCSALDADGEKSADSKFRLWTTVILRVYVGFLALFTVCDLASRYYNVKFNEKLSFLTRLSMAKSAANIISTKARADDVAVIHGLRAISTAWIVLVHEYFAQFYAANLNVFDIAEWFSSPMSLIPLIGLYCVDTFLTISGFLMAYSFFKQRQKTKDFNLILYYLHRFIRLTVPAMMFILFSHVFICGSGPRYEWVFGIFVKGIQSKWWSFALYMQNFLDANNFSAFHLWSLAVDMQLYWISPVIMFLLYKKPRLGLVILGSLIIASISSTAAITGYNNYSAIMFVREPNIQHILNSVKDVYTMPYTRASPWLLGVFLGYKLAFSKQKPSKITLYTGWFLTFTSFAFCVLGTRLFTKESYHYNLPWEVTFAALVRPAWAFAICWIIYASVHNSAGLVSSILSWKYFLPMSKVSYSIYIVHIWFPMLEVANTRSTRYFHDYYIVHAFIGHLAMSSVAAFIFSLIFEVPIITLEDMIFRQTTESIKYNVIKKAD